MSMRNKEFGRLLKEGIRSIAGYDDRGVSWIEKLLAQRIGVSVSTIRHYSSGYVPPEPRTVEILAEALVHRGFLNREWLQEFLDAAGYSNPDQLLGKLYLFEPTDKPDPSQDNTITMHFDFPQATKVPCGQYLLYFVEFLRDIGIEATAELREDAGQVLFSVTPKDKDEALDNIRAALEIYLRLPMNGNTTVVVSPETSIEVQKLSAQIGYFQSQLYLASAALQQKELTIQQRDITIQYQQSLIQQQIASGQVLVQALQRENDDTEPVIGDIIKVKPWSVDAIPVEVDLPTLMRQLKEMFRRKRLP